MSILKQLEAKYGKVRKTNRGFSLISCGNNFIVPIKDNFNVNFCYPIANMLVITAVNDNNKKLAGTHTWENVTCDPDKLLNFIDYYAANCKRSDIGYIDKNNRIVTKEKAINDWKKSLKENGIQSIEKGDSLVCSYNNNKVVLEIPKNISNDFSLYCNSCSKYFENGKEVLNYLNKVSDYKEILKDKINKIEEDSKIKVVKTSKPLMYELRGYGAKAIIRFDKNKLNFYYKSVREDEFDKYAYWSYLEEDKAGKLLRKAKRDNILYKEDGTAYYANEIKLDLSGEKDFEKMKKILKNLGIYASTFSSKSRKTLYLNFNYNGKKYNIISNKGKYSIEYKDLYTWDAYSTIKKNISFDSVVKWINEIKKKVQSSVNLNKYLYHGKLITASSKKEVIKVFAASSSNICIELEDDWENWGNPDEYLYGIKKTDAYADYSKSCIACRTNEIAEKIKKKIAKLENIDVSSIHVTKKKTSTCLTVHEFSKWFTSTFKSSGLSFDGYSVYINKNIPNEVYEELQEKENVYISFPEIVYIDVDDEMGIELVYGAEGLFKGSLRHNSILYDPIKEEFNWNSLKKLIESNLEIVKNKVKKYKDDKKKGVKTNSKDYDDETFKHWLSNVVNLMNYKTNNELHYTCSFFRNKKNVREAFKKYDVDDGAMYLLTKYPR